MDRWKRDGLRSVNNGMRHQVEELMQVLADQRAAMADLPERLAAVRGEARSADGSIEVTVDSSGVVMDVRLTRQALRLTPEGLGRSITETARAAARVARQRADAVIAPITGAADGIPDLSDIVPGAPSIREMYKPLPDDDEPDHAR